MTRLRVVFAGPHITFQDAGRMGHLRFGVPASGPMDRKAFAIAQSVFGNPPEAAAIDKIHAFAFAPLPTALQVWLGGRGWVSV
jgi:allophanate hydrolase subunit 2